MSYLISHQTQPTHNTCFSTCLAMIKAEPAGVVVAQLHERYFAGDMSTREALEQQAIPFESFDTADLPAFDRDGAYLVGVPSLNWEGGMHQIIVECLDGMMVVHDPAMGRPGCKYYMAAVREGAVSEVKLNGFVIDAFVDRAYLLERYAFKLGKGEAA